MIHPIPVFLAVSAKTERRESAIRSGTDAETYRVFPSAGFRAGRRSVCEVAFSPAASRTEIAVAPRPASPANTISSPLANRMPTAREVEAWEVSGMKALDAPARQTVTWSRREEEGGVYLCRTKGEFRSACIPNQGHSPHPFAASHLCFSVEKAVFETENPLGPLRKFPLRLLG